MRVIDVLTFIIIFGIFITGLIIFIYDDEIILKKTQTHYDGKLEIGTWSMFYYFKTTSFTAKNDIELTIIEQATNNYKENFPEQLNNVTKIFVHLPTVYPDNSKKDTIFASRVIELPYNEKNQRFEE